MATVSIRLDDRTKDKLDEFCHDIGLNTSAVMKMFATKVVREQRIPFDVDLDPFYSPANMKELKSRVSNIEKGINCHEHELIEV